jgi:probable DNA repair protein
MAVDLRSQRRMNAMASSVILTANTRLARVLRQGFDMEQVANGNTVWTPPEILPLNSWLERSWRSWVYVSSSANPIQLLSASQELAIWEDIVDRSDAAGELIQVGPTAEAAAAAWLLSQSWNVPFDTSDWDNARDTEAFRGWANEFQRICKKRNCMSSALLPGFVASKITSGEIPVPSHIQLAGFAQVTPAQEGLFESIRRSHALVEILKPPVREGLAKAVRVKFDDVLQEIQAAARWTRMWLEQEGRSGKSIGIVVPELAKYRSMIERVFAEELHPAGRLSPEKDSSRSFNISAGPTLSEFPLIQCALRIIRLVPWDSIPFDDLTLLLRSPFFAKSQTESAACASLDVQLRRLREPSLTVAEISTAAPQWLKFALDEWTREYQKTSGRQFPSAWSAAFARELRTIGWPGERALNSAEYQTAVAWNTLLSDLAGLDSVTGTLNRSRAVSMIHRLAANRQFQPESEPAPVQILGVFEASGMSFDHLWIIGMHDGVWPRFITPNPFLPLSLQRSLNMPQSSAARELEFTRLMTDQLLESSSHVIVSYPSKDGDADLRLSPLIANLPEVPRIALSLNEDSRHAAQLFATRDIEEIQDSVAPPWIGTTARGGTSLFTFQAACPFQAFSKIRLGVERLESPEAGLSPLDRGILLHEILAGVWKELGTHFTLTSEGPSYVNAVVRDAVESAIRKMYAKKHALHEPRFAAVEQSRLERIVGEWLDLEKKRKPFSVLRTEEERKVNVGGIDLTIRADRIDRLEDGTHVVVDYKTSNHSPKKWDGDRPDDSQLPLYASTTSEALSGVVFGVLKTGEIKFSGLTSSEGILPGVRAATGDAALEHRVYEWRQVLETLAADFRSGKAAASPKNRIQSCRYCGLDSLCRISESKIRDEHDNDFDDEVADD